MSNHLICLEKHMLFAAVLNRVLVIPSAKDYIVSVGIAWQIKDFLTYNNTRKVVLGSRSIEFVYHALNVIFKFNIIECLQCDYINAAPGAVFQIDTALTPGLRIEESCAIGMETYRVN
ncbi:hypothetical protein L6452_26203 [Arctium lappa]|uniref:Uncharacterized protein n=1 Tax=Arctium lappa TaxID=4217 RepID=A0ACB9ACJ1_ARCLA|nr:hypothetical protein L6452_26203 [Arctium lappa]